MARQAKSLAAGTTLAVLVTAASAQPFAGLKPATNFDFGFRLTDVALLDVDGDGWKDALLAHDDGDPGTLDWVRFYNGNGDGSFSFPVAYAVGSGPAQIITADLNHDGKPDVATANENTGDVSVLLNTGFAFGPESFYATGGHTVSLDAGYINADAVLDLVALSNDNQNVTVLIGNGAGGFTNQASYPTTAPLTTLGEDPRRLVLEDLNQDGRADVVVAADQEIVVMYNTGSGTLFSGEFADYYPLGTNLQGLAVGDVTNDGRPDIVVVDRDSSQAVVFRNNADGTFPSFTAQAVISTPLHPIAVELADLSDPPSPPPEGAPALLAPDGDLDLIVSCEGADQIAVILNNEGAFSAAQPFGTTGFSPQGLATADVDSDGDLDVVVTQLDIGFDVLLNDTQNTGGASPWAIINSPAHFTQGGCVSGVVQVNAISDVPVGFYGHHELRLKDLQTGSTQLLQSSPVPSLSPGGVLYSWDTAGEPQGFYLLELESYSDSGLSASDEAVVFVNQRFDDVQARYFSVLAGTACIEGTVNDPHGGDITYAVDYAPSGTGTYAPVDPLFPTYTGNRIDTFLASWDTAALADGFYDIRIRASNQCLQTSDLVFNVRVDNTPPELEISIPFDCEFITPGTRVDIIASVLDPTIKQWRVEVSGGFDHRWTTLATGTAEAVDEVLAVWDTTGLFPCTYAIRLVASDSAVADCDGPSEVEFVTTVTLGCPVDMNGDGFLDIGDIQIFIQLFLAGCP